MMDGALPSIGMLHYSAPPIVGGVEAVMQAHAAVMLQAGYPVTIVAGEGEGDALPEGTEFIRVPEMPVSNDYIYHSFEIQISEPREGMNKIHTTGAVYDAEPPSKEVSKPVGEWNRMQITVRGKHINVNLNGEQIIDWDAEPRGKVKDFAEQGYFGLQNHHSKVHVSFRNILVRELKMD